MLARAAVGFSRTLTWTRIWCLAPGTVMLPVLEGTREQYSKQQSSICFPSAMSMWNGIQDLVGSGKPPRHTVRLCSCSRFSATGFQSIHPALNLLEELARAVGSGKSHLSSTSGGYHAWRPALMAVIGNVSTATFTHNGHPQARFFPFLFRG